MARIQRIIGLWLLFSLFGLVLLALALGALLPKSNHLAYVSGQDGDLDIYLRDLGRDMIVNLTNTPENESQPDWSPDGSQIILTLEKDGNADLYIMQVNCPGFFASCSIPDRRLTNAPGDDFDPAWSPDGSQIAFTSERFDNREIMLADVTTGAIERLTDNERLDVNPAWSSDGSSIVFSSDRAIQWNTDLYRMNPDGSNPQPLIQTESNEFSADWSADGSRLIFGRSQNNSVQLMILDVASGTITPLLDDKGYDDAPSWSPDGHWLALSSMRESDYEIYTMQIDCEGIPADCLHRLTFNPAYDTMPVWRP